MHVPLQVSREPLAPAIANPRLPRQMRHLVHVADYLIQVQAQEVALEKPKTPVGERPVQVLLLRVPGIVVRKAVQPHNRVPLFQQAIHEM